MQKLFILKQDVAMTASKKVVNFWPIQMTIWNNSHPFSTDTVHPNVQLSMVSALVCGGQVSTVSNNKDNKIC